MDMIVLIIVIHLTSDRRMFVNSAGSSSDLFESILGIFGGWGDGILLLDNICVHTPLLIISMNLRRCRVPLSIRIRGSRSRIDGMLRTNRRRGNNAFCFSHASCSTRWCRHCNSSARWKPFPCTRGYPVLVFRQWESLIHLVHRHQLLLPPSAVRSSRHVLEIDRVHLLTVPYRTIACIVSKTVLDTDDDPSSDSQLNASHDRVHFPFVHSP